MYTYPSISLLSFSFLWIPRMKNKSKTKRSETKADDESFGAKTDTTQGNQKPGFWHRWKDPETLSWKGSARAACNRGLARQAIQNTQKKN